jgi:hypothetical protein
LPAFFFAVAAWLGSNRASASEPDEEDEEAEEAPDEPDGDAFNEGVFSHTPDMNESYAVLLTVLGFLGFSPSNSK